MATRKIKSKRAPTVKSYISQWPDEFIRCRNDQHGPWNPYTVQKVGRFYEIARKCAGCGTLRHEVINARTGVPVKRPRYVHPKDYLAKGVGHFSQEERGLVRLELIHRVYGVE